jgi:hypothetical protein
LFAELRYHTRWDLSIRFLLDFTILSCYSHGRK